MTTKVEKSDHVVVPIAIGKIVASPYNPRKHFDAEQLRGLAESLKKDGQFQACIARKVGDQFELIGGERRWRAAKIADLPTLQCRVVEVDDAKAIELAGLENYEREQFNACEEAAWFRSMLDKAGYTQAKLATKLKITQGQISQRLGLLELPEAVQTQVITGVMPPSWARHLTPWAKRAEAMAEIVKQVAEGQIANEEDFRRLAVNVLYFFTRPLEGYFSIAGRQGEVAFKPSKEQFAALDSEKLRRHGEWEVRCWNVDLWTKLQDEGERLAAERESKRNEKAKKAADSAPAGEQRAKQKKLAEQFGVRLSRWKIAWLQTLLPALVAKASDADLWRLMIHFAMQRTAQRDEKSLGSLVVDAGGSAKKHSWRGVDPLTSTATVPDGKVRGLVVALLKQWLVMPFDDSQSHLKADDVLFIAKTLGVEVKRDWKLTSEYLDLHTTVQLIELAGDWAIPGHGKKFDGAKRSEIIDIILKRNPTSCPKEVIAAKG